MTGIAPRLSEVTSLIAEACHRAGRDPAEVRLIAVTKSQAPEVLGELAAQGVWDFGENRVDHLKLMHAAAPAGARFHAIGRIQGRQLGAIAARCVALHSLCDIGHVPRLARACADLGRRLPVFLQVNTSGETFKAGVRPDDLGALLEAVRSHPQTLEAVGLMTLAPALDVQTDHVVVRRTFAALRELVDRHGLARLSMGMSADVGIAVEEGATDVRIGSRLFA